MKYYAVKYTSQNRGVIKEGDVRVMELSKAPTERQIKDFQDSSLYLISETQYDQIKLAGTQGIQASTIGIVDHKNKVEIAQVVSKANMLDDLTEGNPELIDAIQKAKQSGVSINDIISALQPKG